MILTSTYSSYNDSKQQNTTTSENKLQLTITVLKYPKSNYSIVDEKSSLNSKRREDDVVVVA
jgi:hypothetical protein